MKYSVLLDNNCEGKIQFLKLYALEKHCQIFFLKTISRQ